MNGNEMTLRLHGYSKLDIRKTYSPKAIFHYYKTLLLAACLFGSVALTTANERKEKFFTNGWAIKVAGSNHEHRVRRIAEKYGFDKISKVMGIFYLYIQISSR